MTHHTPGAQLAMQRRKAERPCAQCGRVTAMLATARYCSNACRQRAKHARMRCWCGHERAAHVPITTLIGSNDTLPQWRCDECRKEWPSTRGEPYEMGPEEAQRFMAARHRYSHRRAGETVPEDARVRAKVARAQDVEIDIETYEAGGG